MLDVLVFFGVVALAMLMVLVVLFAVLGAVMALGEVFIAIREAWEERKNDI